MTSHQRHWRIGNDVWGREGGIPVSLSLNGNFCANNRTFCTRSVAILLSFCFALVIVAIVLHNKFLRKSITGKHQLFTRSNCYRWPHAYSSSFSNKSRQSKPRYLIVPDWSWGTNNNIITVRNAARIALALNRTLIISHRPFLDRLDLESLFAAGYSIHVDKSERIITKYRRILRAETRKNKRRWKSLRAHPITGSAALKCFDHPRSQKVYVSSILLFYGCTDDIDPDNSFDYAFKPSPKIATLVSKAQKLLNLTKYQYVAVHQRWLEGSCRKRARNFKKFRSARAGVACNITLDVVQKIKRQTRIQNNISLFLADDTQNMPARRSLLHAGAGSVRNVLSNISKHDMLLVDMFMLAEAGLMIGNPMSTLSTNVFRLRSVQFARNPELFQPFFSKSKNATLLLDENIITQMTFPEKLGPKEVLERRKMHRKAAMCRWSRVKGSS